MGVNSKGVFGRAGAGNVREWSKRGRKSLFFLRRVFALISAWTFSS